jgi:ornithine cyclodeaminase
MRHFTDDEVDEVLEAAAVLGVLREAFTDFARGAAAMQARVRTGAGAAKLSTMGAVIPAQGYLGAKVYSTLAGRFTFVIVLFDARDGRALATFDAGAVTRWRTAAVSVLAARCGAAAPAPRLAVFGAGVQAHAHLEAFVRAFDVVDVRIVSRGGGEALAARARELGVTRVAVTDARSALDGATLVITATRSEHPLFEGAWVSPGAFVAAVGATRPDTRELDDALLGRAAAIIVEWRAQTLRESGDLLLAAPAALEGKDIVDLGTALAAKANVRRSHEDIVVFKSVGVGLADVAVAGLAYERLAPR